MDIGTLPNTQPIPFGGVVAVVGGIVAQVPQPTVGTAGLIVAITGMTVALFQYFKAFLDYRIRGEVLASLQKDVSSMSDRVEGLQAKLDAANLDNANLKGQVSALMASQVHVETVSATAPK